LPSDRRVHWLVHEERHKNSNPIEEHVCKSIILPRPRSSGKRPDCSSADELGPKADSDALVGIAAAPAAAAVVPQLYLGPGLEPSRN